MVVALAAATAGIESSTVVPAPASAHASPPPVLFSLSESDLNRIVVDAFRAKLRPQLHGRKEKVSSGVSNLRYRAEVTDPVLRLAEDGTARISLEILDADVRIGSLQRREARCEGAGAEIDRANPVAVELTVGFSVDEGALKLVPRSVAIPEVKKRIRLVEPTRCENAPLPRWLLWWLGKPYLKRYIGGLDDLLLKRARDAAARFHEKEDAFLTRGVRRDFRLSAASLDLRAGSLLVGLTPSRSDMPAPGILNRASFPGTSFVGVSEGFVNEVARRVVAERPGTHRISSSSFKRLLSNDAVYALAPGLRRIGSKDRVYVEITYPNAPRFVFEPQGGDRSVAEGARARIRLELSGIDVNFRRDESGAQSLLGSLHVDAARITIVPAASILGGVSFKIVENDWTVSASGLEFDRSLVAATLQELTFSKVFETTYAPLFTRAMQLGSTSFVPRTFDVVDGYLVIGLGDPSKLEPARATEASTRTDTLLGSH